MRSGCGAGGSWQCALCLISDLFVYDKVADGPWALAAVGRYHDSFARQPDGTWLFTRRRLEFL